MAKWHEEAAEEIGVACGIQYHTASDNPIAAIIAANDPYTKACEAIENNSIHLERDGNEWRAYVWCDWPPYASAVGKTWPSAVLNLVTKLERENHERS